jgi:acetoin utilization protein AcuB/CBS domain-containing protein
MYEQASDLPRLAIDVMSSPAVAVEQSSTVAMALCLMYRHNVSRLPVVDGAGGLRGIITYNDIRRHKLLQALQYNLSAPNDSQQYLTVREVMSDQPVALTPESSLHEAGDLLSAHKINALPVVDAAGAVVGILTEQDMFDALILRRDHKLDTLMAIQSPAAMLEQAV